MDSANLTARGVLAVAVTWVDNSGVTRVKAAPVGVLPNAVANGIGASPTFDRFVFDDSVTGGPIGDLRLKPDVSKLTVLAAQPGWAWAPAVRYDQDGNVHPGDSRGLLIRVADELAEQGVSARAAFEIEWCVSKGEGDEFVPACSGPAYGMIRLTELGGYLHDVLDALATQGIHVEQIHPEYAPGQYELSIAHQDPVTAADHLVLVRETIRAVSMNHGLRATFAPKVVAGGVGNGCHVHLSAWRDGENLMGGGNGTFGLTVDGASFIGGILNRLPALLALGAPSVPSYLRLVPSHWAGAFVAWGLENREAALRFIKAGSPNIEIKCFDGSANPYLAMAGLLAAGGAGIAEGASLPEPVDTDPATLAGSIPLPGHLGAAVEAFEAEPTLLATLGVELVDAITSVRNNEIRLLDGLTPEEIVTRSRWSY
ncbi:glutamine synthetase family protein [Kibdelosporangium phytohabitans]|uniref:Glutamine synthetase n=1 Tax=Kibdelosporangium phytohabitans TaxID=860235 RepID=A0A0N9IBD6_9PSEU|nr:glutamine synthetase family protein [Kibdelosporangium phytohabitans]ALG13497.1 glutamine synthetase [Kibdelosporangium phytohabitans]MBE1465347.1 glutamine synthetase [Kibdelosporangium phytohabitans]